LGGEKKTEFHYLGSKGGGKGKNHSNPPNEKKNHQPSNQQKGRGQEKSFENQLNPNQSSPKTTKGKTRNNWDKVET